MKTANQNKTNASLWRKAYFRLSAIYGNKPPIECWSRLAAEESALQGTDVIQAIEVLRNIAIEALIHNSLIMVSGAINSSYVAWLYRATPVNPLKPHYYCPQCGKVKFVADVADGFDLPPKTCSCGTSYERDGHDIPVEDYALSAQRYSAVEIHVSEAFKKTAIRVLKDFYEGVSAILPVLAENADGSLASEKYVVLFGREDIPLVGEDGFWHTTMEEYLHWQGRELVFTFVANKKLDTIQQLQRETQLDLPDIEELLASNIVKTLFHDRKYLLPCSAELLEQKEKGCFDLLLKREGLARATGAWDGNGDHLIKEGAANFCDLPAFREDVWSTIATALRGQSICDYGFATQVMERARMGLYFSQGMPERVKTMLFELGLPSWYPEYLKKIRYLWPKGHCVSDLIVDLTHLWYLQMVK